MKWAEKIILASKSPSRALILKGAGIAFDVIPANLNEGKTIAKSLEAGMAPEDVGMLLAREKARLVSSMNHTRDRIVLGADQILLCHGKVFEKPTSMSEARETLLSLRGKTHSLLANVAIYINGKEIFLTADEAKLTMRDFSDGFLETYLAMTGKKIFSSVGAYQLEGEGVQLFERIEGDFFTILGLPLLSVLDFMRRRGVLGV